MQHWHRFASKRITSWLTCANALAMFRPSAPFLVADWKTSIRRLPRLKDWKSHRETLLKLLRTPSVVSVSFPDNRCLRSALFWIVRRKCGVNFRGARRGLYCRRYFTSDLGFSHSIGVSQTV